MTKPKMVVDVGGIVNKGLTDTAQDTSDFCIDNYGLKYPDINFHVVGLDSLAGVIAAHGAPIAPETWELEQEAVFNIWRHRWGNGGIYEIVSPLVGAIDENGQTKEPIDAFIYHTNRAVITKLVIAHVMGHAHVMHKNRLERNAKDYSGFYSPHSEMVELSQLVEEEYKRQGIMPVAELLDAVKVIGSMVPISPNISLPGIKTLDDFSDAHWLQPVARKPSMWEERIDPVEDKIRKAFEERKGHQQYPNKRVENSFDILEGSPALDAWQRELVRKYRRVQEYLTNVLGPVHVVHEGFASFIHMRFGAENHVQVPEGMLRDYIEFGTSIMGHSRQNLNPYGLGFSLLYNVMMRWAYGEYGVEYDLCTDALRRLNWSNDPDLERGWKKVLEVVENYGDWDLVQNHFTMQYMQKYGRDFYTYDSEEFSDWNVTTVVHSIESKKFEEIKNALLFGLCNSGRPFFCIKEGEADYKGRGELMVTHEIDPLPELFGYGRNSFTLDVNNVESVLKAVYSLWKRPVHLRTIDEKGSELYISYRVANGAGRFSEHINEREV